jgi:hypothetical protein
MASKRIFPGNVFLVFSMIFLILSFSINQTHIHSPTTSFIHNIISQPPLLLLCVFVVIFIVFVVVVVVVVVGNMSHIYLLGGNDGELPSNLVTRFDPQTQTWHAMPAMTANRSYLAAAALQNTLYAFGGFFRVTLKSVEALTITSTSASSASSSTTEQEQEQGTAAHQQQEYTDDQQCWRALPRMRFESRDINACVVSDHEIFVVSDLDGSTHRNHLSMLNTLTEEWIEVLSPMMTLRFGLALCYLDGHIYAIGGYNGSKHLACAERLAFDQQQRNSSNGNCDTDDTDDKLAVSGVSDWEAINDMSRQRVGFAAVAVGSDHRIIVAGGFDGNEVLKCVEIYDPYCNAWSAAAPMHDARSYFAFALLDRHLYVFGGYDGHTNISTYERYCIDTNTWEHLGTMHTNRFAAAACVV